MENLKHNLAPGGYGVVRIYMVVNDVDKQIDFIHVVFGAAINERLKDSEGKAVHAELQIGDSIIWLVRHQRRSRLFKR